ncbi:MAG TPA: response regulator [Bacillota bacterium]|nr:response regulator [Bacillota bacterium]
MLKVLVVDDEKLVRKGIVLGVDWPALGCMVVAEASNGLEGLEAAEKYNPDLIITDIKMPKMDGIEMLRRLRQINKDVYVIFLTAHSDFSYAQRAVKFSASDYLLKPFQDGELEETVLRIKKKITEERKQVDSNIKQFSVMLKKGDKSKYVMEAVDYIANHYNDRNLSIETIAESLGISGGHLSHIFKKETDYTIMSYITRYRIRTAMNMLSDCRHKVYEVAEMVGYRDITYFSSIFKKMVGLSPSEYQDRIRKV